MQQSSLVVVANRLPIDDNLAPDGACDGAAAPAGWSAPCTRCCGTPPPPGSAGPAAPVPPPPSPTSVSVRLRPVPLTDEELRDHYEGFANSTLWPLYHDAVEQPVHHRRWWEAYLRVNRRFAEAAAEVAEAGATVWVQDYHLQLVPRLLRELRPDVRIGFFLHVPFPPPELFMQLPRRAELLRGMLGADLVGFQRAQAAHNFAQLATTLLGLEATDRQDRRRRPDRPHRGVPDLDRRRRDAGARRPSRRAGPGRRSSAHDLGDPRAGDRSASTGWTTPRASSSASRRTASCCADGERAGPRHRPGAGRGARAGSGVEQLPPAAGAGRARGRPDQRRVRPGRRAGHPLPHPALRPGRAGRALPGRRRAWR